MEAKITIEDLQNEFAYLRLSITNWDILNVFDNLNQRLKRLESTLPENHDENFDPTCQFDLG